MLAQTKTSKTSKTTQPKEYNFQERKKIQGDCKKMADRLFKSLRQALPKNQYDALWDFAYLQNAKSITVLDSETIDILLDILREAPAHIKQLKTKG